MHQEHPAQWNSSSVHRWSASTSEQHEEAKQILETYKVDGFLVCRVIDAKGVWPWRFTCVSHK